MAQFLAILLGYLLGSIPTAYLLTKRRTGSDIRRLGGGNAGALNTFREVSAGSGVLVALIDLAKGAAAVAIAYWLLELTPPYVMAAGLAAVVGHNWPVWTGFSGGRGLAPAFGAIIPIMLIYGATTQLLIMLAIILVPFAFTRNVALSTGLGLLALPFLAWSASHSRTAVLYAVAVALIIAGRFFWGNRQHLFTPENRKNLIVDHWRRPPPPV